MSLKVATGSVTPRVTALSQIADLRGVAVLEFRFWRLERQR